jgi:DNA polymerase-1
MTHLAFHPKKRTWELDHAVALPNVRRFFVPDPGYTLFDTDLDRADLQVVVWEADDKDLKEFLRMGVDVHLVNGIDLENLPLPPIDELVETHSQYPEHRAKFGKQRIFAKAWVHGTNYGGSAATMARAAKCSTAQSQLMQDRWFARHPGIKRWHERTEHLLLTKRMAINAFGFRRVYLDRVSGLLPEALAWVPQSTVALYINMIWDKWVTHCPEIQVLMQVHDSLVFQLPTHIAQSKVPYLRALAAEIQIPYPDPLVIPVGFKSSESSWGEVH